MSEIDPMSEEYLEVEKTSSAKLSTLEENVFEQLDGDHGIPSVNVEDGPSFRPHNYLTKMPGGAKALPSKVYIIWFRKQCPGWSVVTHQKDDETINKVVCRKFYCEIYDPKGKLRSTGTKTWSVSRNFPTECAETGSVNRAIINLGFNALVARCGFDPDGNPPFWYKESNRITEEVEEN